MWLKHNKSNNQLQMVMFRTLYTVMVAKLPQATKQFVYNNEVLSEPVMTFKSLEKRLHSTKKGTSLFKGKR